jgi:hypothetical protein
MRNAVCLQLNRGLLHKDRKSLIRARPGKPPFFGGAAFGAFGLPNPWGAEPNMGEVSLVFSLVYAWLRMISKAGRRDVRCPLRNVRTCVPKLQKCLISWSFFRDTLIFQSVPDPSHRYGLKLPGQGRDGSGFSKCT